MMKLKYVAAAILAAMVVGGEAAVVSSPKAAVKALKVTKGKKFDAGLVFIDGKYIEPPYCIERYGTVIRVNGVVVTGQIIPWVEFIQTQDGAKVTKSETAAPEGEPEPEPEPAEEPEDDLWGDDDDDPLADLFADDDEPKKKKGAKPAKRKAVRRPKKPTVTTTVEFDGEFVANEKSNELLAKINRKRTDIDKSLRTGAFFCFGKDYAPVSSDSGITRNILQKLPDLQKNCSDLTEFTAGVRKAGFGFFPENLIRDLYRNRVDYLKLEQRRRKTLDKEQFDAVLNGYEKRNEVF